MKIFNMMITKNINESVLRNDSMNSDESMFTFTLYFYIPAKFWGFFQQDFSKQMGVSENRGGPSHSNTVGFSIIFTIHFGGPPLFLETPKCCFVVEI